MRDMENDPSVDVDLLRKHFGKNYTEMLGLKRFNSKEEEEADKETDPENILNLKSLDAYDKKRIK